jgi:hypothetical protein
MMGSREDHANLLWLVRHDHLSPGRLVIGGTAGLRNNSLAPSVIIVADPFMNRKPGANLPSLARRSQLKK